MARKQSKDSARQAGMADEAAHDPFLSKEELVAHLKGAMFPKGKRFAPSLVMWGDPHGEEHDIDALEHLSGPDDQQD